MSRFDYDFFQLERAAAEGVSVDKLGEQPRGPSDSRYSHCVLPCVP